MVNGRPQGPANSAQLPGRAGDVMCTASPYANPRPRADPRSLPGEPDQPPARPGPVSSPSPPVQTKAPLPRAETKVPAAPGPRPRSPAPGPRPRSALLRRSIRCVDFMPPLYHSREEGILSVAGGMIRYVFTQQSARDAALAELARLDPAALDAAALMGEITDLATFISQAQGQLSRLTATLDSTGGAAEARSSSRRRSCAPGAAWRRDGPPQWSPPPAAWPAWKPPKRRCTPGRSPSTSPSSSRPPAGLGQDTAGLAEQVLLDHAPGLDTARFRQFAEEVAYRADPDAADEREQRRWDKRHLSFGLTLDNTGMLSGTCGDAVSYEILRTAAEALTPRGGQGRRPDGGAAADGRPGRRLQSRPRRRHRAGTARRRAAHHRAGQRRNPRPGRASRPGPQPGPPGRGGPRSWPEWGGSVRAGHRHPGPAPHWRPARADRRDAAGPQRARHPAHRPPGPEPVPRRPDQRHPLVRRPAPRRSLHRPHAPPCAARSKPATRAAGRPSAAHWPPAPPPTTSAPGAKAAPPAWKSRPCSALSTTTTSSTLSAGPSPATQRPLYLLTLAAGSPSKAPCPDAEQAGRDATG